MTKEEQWLLKEKYHGVANAAFDSDRVRLASGEPLAYVIGTQPFLGLTIHLDSHPLIPRPETEWWTEQMLNSLATPKSVDDFRFLDLCAGSGAIGCAALAKLPDADVYFGELDPNHGPTIEKNIRNNRLDALRAHIGIGDLFAPFGDMKFDVIAANPPYIPVERTLSASVAEYEPPLALFAGDDGLSLIRRIARELFSHLADGGVAWIECDSAHAETARVLFEKQGFTAQIRTDQYGTPRVIVVSFP